jgi:hypothetical protein
VVRFGSNTTPPRKNGKAAGFRESEGLRMKGPRTYPRPKDINPPVSQRREAGKSQDVARMNSVPPLPFTEKSGERSRRFPPTRNFDDTICPPVERGHGKGCLLDSPIPAKVAESQSLPDLRNYERLERANRKDADLIGKYLPSSVSDLFADVVQGPDDFFVPQRWLLDAVREVALASAPTPGAPLARFDISDDSREFNSRLIESYGNNFQEFLADQAGTTMSYGAEFRPVNQL